MIDTGDLRKGMTLDWDGRLVKVIDFAHNKQGRGSAQVRLTVRDLRTGSTTQHSDEGGHLHFMDTETFDQFVLDESAIGDAIKNLKENDTLDLLTYDGEPIDVE